MNWLDKQIADFFECCKLSRKNRLEVLMYLLLWSVVLFAAVNTVVETTVLLLVVLAAHAVCLEALNKVFALVVFGPLVLVVKAFSLTLHGVKKAIGIAIKNALQGKVIRHG